MPLRFRIAETTLRSIVLDTDDQSDGHHTISELYADKVESPGVGEMIGFTFAIQDVVHEDDTPLGVDCGDCRGKGWVSLHEIKVSFRCGKCGGSGVLLHDRVKPEPPDPVVAAALDNLTCGIEESDQAAWNALEKNDGT